MQEMNTQAFTPWASFCMSTYKRPDFLKKQIEVLLKQTLTNFEIVISDNDPDASGKAIAESFNDARVQYACNINNLGMVKSFNRSISRARGEYIVMVTDDDPVFENMLSFFYDLQNKYPGYSIYCGAKRTNKKTGEIELIKKTDFINEVLSPHLTPAVHWSSALLKRDTLLKIGMLADYGSGHLVDHAMLALMGSQDGAVVINREFSEIQLHGSNYSKANFENYYTSCKGFYDVLTSYFAKEEDAENKRKEVITHLHNWFIVCFFALRRFYTVNGAATKELLQELDSTADKIMQLPYMSKCRFKYAAKKIIFWVKKNSGLLKSK